MNPPELHPVGTLVDQDFCLRTLTLYATGRSVLDVPLKDRLIMAYAKVELQTPFLEQLAPWLWLFSKKSSSNIDPIHGQLNKTREIALTEDPDLHLVWHGNVIYIKPIPIWLLCRVFWDQCLIQSNNDPLPHAMDSGLAKAAIGFLRSYSWLIRHPTDFLLAQQKHLIPENVDFLQFEAFIGRFRAVSDASVTQRYHFGQIRLSRLNLATRLIRPVVAVGAEKQRRVWYYHETRWTASQYVKDYLAVLLSVFGVLTITLSSMQVVMTASASQRPLARGFWGLAITVLVFCGIVVVVWVLAIGLVLFVQIRFAVKMKSR
jgi:hypothetical protein